MKIKISENNNLCVTHVIMLSDHVSDITIVQFVPWPVEKIDLQINLLIRSNHIYTDKTMKGQVLERDLLVLYADLVIHGIKQPEERPLIWNTSAGQILLKMPIRKKDVRDTAD